MREIKFRGNRVNNGKWVYGLPLYSVVGAKVIIDTIQSYEDLRFYKVIPETVGQFTGLHDKNGKEIYEGDIVTYPDASSCGDSGEWDCFTNMGVVDYCVNTMSYYFTDRVSVDMDEIDIEVEVEIIGNIHDNPELLKEVSHEA